MRLKEIVSYSLDHGVVIDAFAEISLDGIELVQVEAQVSGATRESFQQYAEFILLAAAAADRE